MARKAELKLRKTAAQLTPGNEEKDPVLKPTASSKSGREGGKTYNIAYRGKAFLELNPGGVGSDLLKTQEGP